MGVQRVLVIIGIAVIAGTLGALATRADASATTGRPAVAAAPAESYAGAWAPGGADRYTAATASTIARGVSTRTGPPGASTGRP